LPQGEVTISFYAQDTAGNLGIKTVKIIKSIPLDSPKNLPYIIAGVAGAVGVGGVIVFRKRISKLKKYTGPIVKKIKKYFKKNAPE